MIFHTLGVQVTQLVRFTMYFLFIYHATRGSHLVAPKNAPFGGP